MKMFIFSEIMFFSRFFCSLFYTIFIREVEVRITFPGSIVNAIDPLGIPLLNTVLLLSSGVTVTWGHRGLTGRSLVDATYRLLASLVIGFVFLICQYIEYMSTDFTISSRIYACNFFAVTGFHRFHVFVRIVMLLVSLLRCIMGNIYFGKRIRIECSI